LAEGVAHALALGLAGTGLPGLAVAAQIGPNPNPFPDVINVNGADDNSAVPFTNDGYIFVNGTGTVSNTGSLDNNGTLDVFPGGTIDNSGTLQVNHPGSYYGFYNAAGATIHNSNSLQISPVSAIYSGGRIYNQAGGTIDNNGILDNYGTIYNYAGAALNVNNSTDNYGVIANYGTLKVDRPRGERALASVQRHHLQLRPEH
jgi:hypothetical protein